MRITGIGRLRKRPQIRGARNRAAALAAGAALALLASTGVAAATEGLGAETSPLSEADPGASDTESADAPDAEFADDDQFTSESDDQSETPTDPAGENRITGSEESQPELSGQALRNARGPVPMSAQVDGGADCAAGYVYVLGSGSRNSRPRDGQVLQVAPDGTLTEFGPRLIDSQMNSGIPGNSSDTVWNSLGMSADGGTMYVIARTKPQQARIWKWEADGAAGSWGTGPIFDENVGQGATGNGFSGFLLAGAVDPTNGSFVYGGYNTGNADTNTKFMLWSYDPVTGTNTYMGDIPVDGNDAGDIVFDRQGNLYLLSGNADDTQTFIYSVTRDNYMEAQGGPMERSKSQERDFVVNANGVAFDANGEIYATANPSGSSGGQLWSGTMPDFAGASMVKGSLFGGMTTQTPWATSDAASCGFPPTITLQKIISGGRIEADHQFELNLELILAPEEDREFRETVTTAGDKDGLQAQQIGPIPTSAGHTFAFDEDLTAAYSDWPYDTYYQCMVRNDPDGEFEPMEGLTEADTHGQLSGTVVMPSAEPNQSVGAEVLCQFVNSPFQAKVIMHKDLLPDDGSVRQPEEGWDMNMTAEYTGGAGGAIAVSPVDEPSGDPLEMQQTAADGNAEWTIGFASGVGEQHTHELSAKVNLFEGTVDPYIFIEGQCVLHKHGTEAAVQVFPLDGDTATEGIEVTVAPGDELVCTYLNGKTPALQLCKDIEPVSGGVLEAAGLGASRPDWLLSAQNTEDPSEGYEDAPCSDYRQVSPGTYELSERVKTADDGNTPAKETIANTYDQLGDWTCTTISIESEDGQAVPKPVIDSNKVTLDETDFKVNCRVTNQSSELTILKDVTGIPDARPSDFEIKAEAADSGLDVPGLSAVGMSAIGTANSILVKPGETYNVSEEISLPHGLPYLQKSFQQYTGTGEVGETCPLEPTPAALADDSCWTTVSAAGTKTSYEVSVAQGERGIYRYTNVAINPPDLPLTGGRAATMFTVVGVLLLTTGVAYSTWKRRRSIPRPSL